MWSGLHQEALDILDSGEDSTRSLRSSSRFVLNTSRALGGQYAKLMQGRNLPGIAGFNLQAHSGVRELIHPSHRLVATALPSSTSRRISRALSDKLCSVRYPRITPRPCKTEL